MIVEQLVTVVLAFALCTPHLVHDVTAQVANITIPPQLVIVPIGTVVEFTCTAVANSFTWQANGQQLDNGRGVFIMPVAVNEAQNIRMTTLRLIVSSIDDATNITCTAISLSPFSKVVSNPAPLIVQGQLGPVSDLTVVPINSTTVLISWSPPFTLEGVPILGYNVIITNTTSGENETMSVEGDTTMLYYSIDHPDPDNNFTVTVVPINGAGPGEPVTTLFSFSFVVFTTSVLPSPTLPTSIFQTTLPSPTQDVPSPPVSITATVSVSVTPSLMGPTDTDPTVGPIIGGIIGVILVLSLVIALCAAVIGVIYYRRRMAHKRMKLSHAVHCVTSENPYQLDTTPTGLSHRGDSGIAAYISADRTVPGRASGADHNEDTAQTTSTAFSPSRPLDSETEENLKIVDKVSDDHKSVTLSEPRPTEQTSLHNEDIHASQPVSKSPQLVPKSPQPAVVPFSIPSHDLKKYQVADDDRLPPVTTTMTAVAVCGEQSEYSKPVIVREHVSSQKKLQGKKDLNYIFVRKVCLQSDKYTLVKLQDADDELSEAVLPSLRRTSSQPSIVDELSEASQTYSEYLSHPFGYADLRIAYKRIQHFKKKEEAESTKSQPKETQYAELADFNTKRPAEPPQIDAVQYATISSATHDRTCGNMGDQRRQAKVHVVPSDEDIAWISQQVAHKWSLIGQQLGVDSADLDQIASECDSDPFQCCSELFRKWAAGEITASCPFT